MPEAVAEKKPIRMSDLRAVPVRRVRARFESAETTDNNRRHWARADGLSADAAASSDVRHILRTRCRYEVSNNSYARGIVLTLANDTVGTGPRLQMLTGDDTLNRQVENEFHNWAQAIELAEKLRTMRQARAQDGEAFAILATNPKVDHPVQLDLRLVEADQVASPFGLLSDNEEIDGIRLDRFGNPVSYRVLKHHPGDIGFHHTDDASVIPARAMIHIFRADRPGQHRGTPEIAPAIALFAQLRRFTLAVLSAAEAAADFAGILYTDAPPSGEADAVEPMDRIELERNMLLTMPGGWKMGQVEPQQSVPLLANHENRTASRVGVVSARVEGGSLVIEGEIVSGSGQAMGIVEQAKARADWQLSIGAEVKDAELIVKGRSREVNGQMHDGPFYHVKAAVLREVSVVAVGADGSTRMKVAASFSLTGGPGDRADSDRVEVQANGSGFSPRTSGAPVGRSTVKGGVFMDFNEWLKGKGHDQVDLSDEKVKELRAAYEKEMAGPDFDTLGIRFRVFFDNRSLHDKIISRPCIAREE